MVQKIELKFEHSYFEYFPNMVLFVFWKANTNFIESFEMLIQISYKYISV